MSDLRAKVAPIPFWYHRIELPDGVVTPGWAPVSAEAYRLPTSMIGQRVLDVGAWDGYWTFEALRKGAFEVVAVDDFSDDLAMENVSRAKKWESFDLCSEALGYGSECVSRREMSVYDISPDNLGMFDSVLFFGTLYHLRHPLLALEKLASVCKDTLYVESAICDDFSPYRGMNRGYPTSHVVMEFYPDAQYGGNATNWRAPNLACLGHMVRVAGFDDVQVWKLEGTPTDIPRCRGFARGRKLGTPGRS